MKILKNYLLIIFVLIGLLVHNSCSNSSAQNETIIVKSKQILNEDGFVVKTRFNTPEGFVRVKSKKNSFGEYLQNLPLLPNGSKVKHFDGSLKTNTSAYCAVVNLPFKGNPNHQCADAIMRLRAEYLFSQKKYNEIEFFYVSGFKSNYINFLEGRNPSTNNLWKYMCGVFSYANTYSLSKQLKSKPINDLQIGDVFIVGGFPGHAVIVVDKCVNKNGEVKFMLAQSYMPAQDIQILVGDDRESPWYDLNFGEYLYSSEFTFNKSTLKSF